MKFRKNPSVKIAIFIHSENILHIKMQVRCCKFLARGSLRLLMIIAIISIECYSFLFSSPVMLVNKFLHSNSPQTKKKPPILAARIILLYTVFVHRKSRWCAFGKIQIYAIFRRNCIYFSIFAVGSLSFAFLIYAARLQWINRLQLLVGRLRLVCADNSVAVL